MSKWSIGTHEALALVGVAGLARHHHSVLDRKKAGTCVPAFLDNYVNYDLKRGLEANKY